MKKMILAGLLIAGGATNASADPLMKYTYTDVAYQWTHIDIEGINDSNGADAKLSVKVVDNFALEGGYNYANSGITNANVNINQSTFRYGGAGWYSLCPGYDILARIGGAHVQSDSSAGDVSDNGAYGGVGVRYLFTDTFEGDADVLYDSVNSLTNPAGGGWTYGITGLNTLADHLALKVGAAIDGDANVAVTAGLRWDM